MNRTGVVGVVYGVLVLAIISSFMWLFANDGRAKDQQPPPAPVPVIQALGPTDLKVGVVYEVLRTRLERLPSGVVRAWYFTGKDRSLRSQYTPELDGRGRRIMRVVTNDPTLSKGHMRLVQVSEKDPSLEGFTFGNYNWTGIQIQVNPRNGLVPQRTIPNGGPARH